MTQEGFKRKLTAILSADVEGYSRLMVNDEEATVRTLTTYRNVITNLTRQFSGRVVDSPGDNILADFTSVVDAVNCAVEIQRGLAERNAELPDNRKMQFRIGINLGDVLEEDDRIYGDGVNIAARVESLAEAGGICISGSVFDHVENKLDYEYEYMGEKRVKNIYKPVRLYRVREKSNNDVIYVREKLKLPDKPSIAVLPFNNMSGDPGQEYFCDGLTENIIYGLSSCPNLLVISRNSTFFYKGRPVNVQQVAHDLGVEYIVEGSIQKVGDYVRITAQLIKADTDQHIWADKYDRTLENIFDLQDEITIKLITAMSVHLTEGEQAQLRFKKVRNLEAYLKIIKGLFFLSRGNKIDNILARQAAEEAISLDPEDPNAYVLLADTYRTEMWRGVSSSSPINSELVKKYIDKVFELEEDNSDAHWILGMLYFFKGQYEKAIVAAKRAVALNPNGADAHCILAYILDNSGKTEEALRFYKKAFRLNPFPPNWYYQFLGETYLDMERYEEAIGLFKKAVDMEPNDLWSHLGLVVAYSQIGQFEKAQTEVGAIYEIDPEFSLDEIEKYESSIDPEYDKENYWDVLRKAGLN